MSRGRHKLETVNSRTLPEEFHGTTIPAGHRAARCAAKDCSGALFIGRTQDELDRQHETHVLHLRARGQGATIEISEAAVHVPVLFSAEEGEAPFRDTLIMPLDEWAELSDVERQSWVEEEGGRRIDAHRARLEEISSRPEPTPEELRDQHEETAKRAEATWFDAKAAQARLEAEALAPSNDG